MVGVYFGMDKTQMVRAKVKGDKKLSIKEIKECGSCYKYFAEKADAGTITQLFEELKEEMRIGREDVYLVLPDEIFEMTDTANITSEEELRRFVEECTGLEYEELYVREAIKSTPGTNNKKTIYAISKNIVEVISEAADKINMQVVSIEAASMAMIRALGDWKREKILIPVSSGSANIISYSPLGGIFKLETNLSEKKLEEEELRIAIRQRDVAAEYTFTSINENVPVNILSNKMKVKIEGREGEELKIQNCVEFNQSVRESEWLAAVGTLLQVYGEETEIFADCPPFLKIGSGNIMPEEKQVRTKVKHWQQRLKKWLGIITAIMVVAVILGVIVILYLNSFKITEELQSRYDEAQKTDTELSREMRIIEQAHREDEKPIEAYVTLMQYRMDDLYLTNIAIGGNDTTVNWVKFTAVSDDPIKFQDLLSRLREEPKFQNSSLAEISSEANDYKKANFSLGKGREES